MKGKILIGILLIFLVIGTVCAVEYTSLKNPKDFKPFDTFGVSQKETDGRVELTVVPVNDDAVKYMKANGAESQDHIFKYDDYGYSAKDGKFGYEGYTEVVDINGEEFVVSVLFDSKMSPSEERQFLEVLTEFNELNNLTPIEV